MKKHRSISVTALAGAAALSSLCVGPALSAVTRATHNPPPESVCRHCTPPLAIQAPAPPSGFNPVTASDEELAFYGYPPRPDARTSPDAYNSWERGMSLPVKRVKTTFQQTTISNGPIQILSEGTKVPGTVATGTSSSNWSGYADVVASNPFKKVNTTVYGVFVVPIAQQAFGSCTGNWDYSSQWIGIDGYGSSDVFQAGYEADAYCSGGTTTPYYSAWYEWYPNNETRIGGFPANGGDVIYMWIWPTSLTTGDYYIVNQTANTATSAAFSAPSGTTLKGNSAEWVVERPGVNGSLATLTNYVDVPWYYAFASIPGANGTSTEYSSAQGHAGTIYSITMDDNSNNGISDSFTSTNNGLTYVNPTGTKYFYSGTALWFQDFGSAF